MTGYQQRWLCERGTLIGAMNTESLGQRVKSTEKKRKNLRKTSKDLKIQRLNIEF